MTAKTNDLRVHLLLSLELEYVKRNARDAAYIRLAFRCLSESLVASKDFGRDQVPEFPDVFGVEW